MSNARIKARPSLQAAATMLESAQLPSADLSESHLEHFFFSGPPQTPTGLVGLELCGPDVLLRSLVVDPRARASGLGSALLARAEAHARAHGARAVYLLTTTAEAFFARRGYARVGREAAPQGIRTTREFADICPASSAFMVKQLQPEET